MTGQNFQDRLDALVEDLQTKGKGQQVEIALRNTDGSVSLRPLSSDANGVINAGQMTALQGQINGLKPIADAFETEYAPVKAASEAFRDARAPHQALIDSASAARLALQNALDADQNYQDAKAAYDAAREDAGYIAAREAYRSYNVSENYGNLQEAKGKYAV